MTETYIMFRIQSGPFSGTSYERTDDERHPSTGQTHSHARVTYDEQGRWLAYRGDFFLRRYSCDALQRRTAIIDASPRSKCLSERVAHKRGNLSMVVIARPGSLTARYI